jgi:hypothetical protein
MEPKLSVLYYVRVQSLLMYINLVFVLIVGIIAFSLPGARLFFGMTLIGELGLVLAHVDWLYVNKHLLVKECVRAFYKTCFAVFFLLGGCIVALNEINVCYFADYHEFRRIIECSNLITRGTSSSIFSSKAVNTCESSSRSVGGLLGECVAAQVTSVDNIKVARGLGVFCACLILLQVVICLVCLVIHKVHLQLYFDAAANDDDVVRKKLYLLCMGVLGKAPNDQNMHVIGAGEIAETLDAFATTLARPSSKKS